MIAIAIAHDVTSHAFTSFVLIRVIIIFNDLWLPPRENSSISADELIEREIVFRTGNMRIHLLNFASNTRSTTHLFHDVDVT